MDDTWVIQQQVHKELFLDHINSVDPVIKFTVEGNQEDGAIPFLDTLVKPMADNSLSIKVYCKPMHTDQYLQWDSHHNLSAKYSVIGTLTHRTKVVCTSPELLNEELQHLKDALGKCKYPSWAINKVQNKIINGNQQHNTVNNNHGGITMQGTSSTSYHNQLTGLPRGRPTIAHMVIPYVQGLGESFKHICARYGIKVYFKGNRTLKQLLVQPKDKDPKEKQSGVIYHYQCPAIDCGEEYIGETSRTLREQCREHDRTIPNPGTQRKNRTSYH